MNEAVQMFLIGNIFRVVCLLVGLAFAYLGYRLYVKGVFDKTQDLKASFGNAKIALRHVAPGVVFGIAGIIIAIIAVVRPVKVEQRILPMNAAQTPTINGLQPMPMSTTGFNISLKGSNFDPSVRVFVLPNIKEGVPPTHQDIEELIHWARTTTDALNECLYSKKKTK